ncbi:hypothetical protein Q7P35_001406 [Cladosporium inversicolor]
MLRYAPNSTPDDIRLELVTVDRDARPEYTALSYVWGTPSPLHTIKLNGTPFDVQPNLHRALRYLRRALTGFFWVDAVCINQQDIAERTSQVRAMSETYGNAGMVAAWIGPCDDVIRPLFRTPIESIPIFSGRTTASDPMLKAREALATRRYWTRIWIQQEILLQTNVMLFCGEYQQPLYPLIDWFEKCEYQLTVWYPGGSYQTVTNSHCFGRLRRFRDMIRKPTLLEIVTYFSECESKDRRDKIFALISLVEGPEREALNGILPNYSLSLCEVIKIVLRHVRAFSGQKRCACQLDSILVSLGEPGDTLCHRATFGEYYKLRRMMKDGHEPRKVVTPEEAEKLAHSSVLLGEISWLEIFRCIYSPLDGEGRGSVDVWALDPELPVSRERHLLAFR